MRKPSVAVITRTKDRPLLLERAIKSVMNQSFEGLMMVIVNDGGSPKPIEELLRKHKRLIAGRVKLINNESSTGMENAANTGVKNSDSKYIAMLDDDDTWHPDFLKTTVEFLENNPYEGVVTASTIISESIEGNKIKKLGEERFVPLTQINYFSMLGANQFPNNAFVFSRQAQKKTGDYDQSVDVLGDWEFNMRFLKNYDIHFIDKPLVYYHQRQSQTGSLGNSIFVTSNLHTKLNTYLLNKYLREDLEAGKLGVGFIANLSQQMLVARSEDLTLLNDLIRQSTSETHNGINSLHEKASEILSAVNHLHTRADSLAEAKLKRRARSAFDKVKKIRK